MVRKIEFMRRSEARIIVFLMNADVTLRNGKNMAKLLDTDYIYLMKIMEQMYVKGWVQTHRYAGTTFFKITLLTPIKEAKAKLAEAQTMLKRYDEETDDNR